jgi:glycosyltransferase involved in cell wall biosynthesis
MAAGTRILLLVSTLRQSGPTMQLHNILRHLDRGEFEPVVLTLSGEPADTMIGSFRELGVRVESLAMSRFRSMVERHWRHHIERATGLDLDDRCVVHSQGIRADTISARHLPTVPRLVTVHNYPYDDYPLKFGAIQGRWMAREHLRALQSLPLLVACSASLSRALARHGLRSAVIRNAVDTSRFRMSSSRARERTRLGLTEDDRAGVCVGSLIARKNPLGVVRAVKRSGLQNLVMLFVGTGVLAAALRRESRADARIRLVGHCEDVLPYLQAADFFVSASRSEGLPTAVLEALVCGLPAVLSDIEPHREILELLPHGGSLCDPDATAALTSAIEALAQRPDGTGPALAASARELFGAERMSQSYQHLYRQLIATHRGSAD